MQTSSLLKKNSSGDENLKAFVMHMTSFNLNLMSIHPAGKAQIALLIIEKMQIPSKYLDFSDVFSKKKVSILSEVIEINQHTIKL